MLQAPMAAPPPTDLSREAPTGSLWAKNTGSFFQDIKAKKIGDILTITVSEESKGSKDATTATTRAKGYDGSASFAGVGAGAKAATPVGGATFGPYKGTFSTDFTGSGSTSRTDSMTAYMTATVIDVLPNGNLVIRGSRWTKVNEEMQQTVLEGVVRPMDVTRNNTVLSQSIAEAKIFLVGKGMVTKQQKPGWLGQALDYVAPF
jgi:flagellar L-ring protein FlgH